MQQDITKTHHSVVNILAAGYTEHIQTAENIQQKHKIVIDKYTVITAQQKIQSRELDKKNYSHTDAPTSELSVYSCKPQKRNIYRENFTGAGVQN